MYIRLASISDKLIIRAIACAPNSILLKVKAASRTAHCVSAMKVSDIPVSQDSEAASPGAWRLLSATEAVPGGSPLRVVVAADSLTYACSVCRRDCVSSSWP